MSNIHIRLNPLRTMMGVVMYLVFEDEGQVLVAHIVDGHIEGEPFRFAGQPR